MKVQKQNKKSSIVYFKTLLLRDFLTMFENEFFVEFIFHPVANYAQRLAIFVGVVPKRVCSINSH